MQAHATLDGKPLIHQDGTPVYAGDLQVGKAYDFDPRTGVLTEKK